MKTIIHILFLLCFVVLFQLNGDAQNYNRLNEKFVIIVNVQEEYTNVPDSNSYVELIESINSIIAHSNPDKIIYIQQIHKVLSFSFRGFKVDTLPISEMDSRLKVVNHQFFGKGESNAFNNNVLVDFLVSQQAKEIVVVGLMAESCIYKTVLGAKKKGYDAYIVPAAIIGKTVDGKDKAINRLMKKGIKTLPLDELTRMIN